MSSPSRSLRSVGGGLADGGGHDRFLRPQLDGPNGGNPAATHDRDAIADTEEFGQVGADENDGLAVSRQFADEFVNLRFAADVDAARRFVEKQDFGIVMEKAAKRYLLLIAAG